MNASQDIVSIEFEESLLSPQKQKADREEFKTALDRAKKKLKKFLPKNETYDGRSWSSWWHVNYVFRKANETAKRQAFAIRVMIAIVVIMIVLLEFKRENIECFYRISLTASHDGISFQVQKENTSHIGARLKKSIFSSSWAFYGTQNDRYCWNIQRGTFYLSGSLFRLFCC